MANGTLRTELITDPLDRGYAEMTDQEVVNSLLTVDIHLRQRVSIQRLQEVAYQSGVAVALNTAVQTPETPVQLKALCLTVLGIVDSRLDSIDFDDPAAAQMFGALKTYGVINPTQAAALDALANGVVSRASQLGLGDVTAGEVGRARA